MTRIQTLEHNGNRYHYITGIGGYGFVTQFGTEIITKKKRKYIFWGDIEAKMVLGGVTKMYHGCYGSHLYHKEYWEACLMDFEHTIKQNENI